MTLTESAGGVSPPPSFHDREPPDGGRAVGGAAGGAGLDPEDVPSRPQAPRREGRAAAPERPAVELAEEGRAAGVRDEAELRGAVAEHPPRPADEPGLGSPSTRRFPRAPAPGSGSPPWDGPGGVQTRSAGGNEFGRGAGKASKKSAALSLRSSAASSRVGQPGTIVRRSASPSGMPDGSAGDPAGDAVPPWKLPQETQSSASQQTAPPAGSRLSAAIAVSARTPNCDSAAGVAARKVAWLAPLGASAPKLADPEGDPAASKKASVWPPTRFCPAS